MSEIDPNYLFGMIMKNGISIEVTQAEIIEIVKKK